MILQKKTAATIVDLKTPYEAGYDCGLNGANVYNSHFKWFSLKESLDEWNRGKKDGTNKKAEQ